MDNEVVIPPGEGAFLKAMIKINNPTWTLAQIEAEYLKQKLRRDESDDGCESCSG